MAKISNEIVYIPNTEIEGLDYFIGTDFSDGKRTVNFRIQDLGSHYNTANGVRNLDYFFYNHISANPRPTDGYFYSNGNEQDPNNITHFIFSKKTMSKINAIQFFDSITAINPFDLIISQKVGINSIYFFRIDSVQKISDYFKLNVSKIFYPENNSLEYTDSFAVFNIKASGISVTKTSDLINDGADGTSTYVEKDELSNVAESGDYNDLTNIPATFTPSAHTHIEADITDLDKYTKGETDNLLGAKIDKTDLESFDFNGAGSDISIQLPTNDASTINLTNSGLISVSSFDLSLLTDPPYLGKPFTIRNNTGSPVTFKHNQSVLFFGKKIITKDGNDIIIPNNEMVRFDYATEGMKDVFRSWGGGDYVKRTDFGYFNSNASGSNQTIVLDAGGATEIRLLNPLLTSISAFDDSLINLESKFDGKLYLIRNLTGRDVTIVSGPSVLTKSVDDLVIKDREVYMFSYSTIGTMTEVLGGGSGIDTDASLYLDPITKELRGNVGQETENFTYTSGVQAFTLVNEPSNLIYLYVDKIPLINPLTEWSISGKVLTILNTLSGGEKITINYQFIITI